VVTERIEPRPDLLRRLDESLAGLTGQEFFRVLARTLAEELRTHCAFVCEFTDGNTVAQPFAFWYEGKLLDGAPYPLAGTPCETVLGGDIVVYDRDVCDRFPHHRAELEAVRAESYIAIPMRSRSNEIMGQVLEPRDGRARAPARRAAAGGRQPRARSARAGTHA
jgi:hypothetical protein